MVSECGVFIVGVIIQLASTHVWQQFAVGRFVSGIAVGALSAAVPMVGGVYLALLKSMGHSLSSYSVVPSGDCSGSNSRDIDVSHSPISFNFANQDCV